VPPGQYVTEWHYQLSVYIHNGQHPDWLSGIRIYWFATHATQVLKIYKKQQLSLWRQPAMSKSQSRWPPKLLSTVVVDPISFSTVQSAITGPQFSFRTTLPLNCAFRKMKCCCGNVGKLENLFAD
jgi:hypothetical protein